MTGRFWKIVSYALKIWLLLKTCFLLYFCNTGGWKSRYFKALRSFLSLKSLAWGHLLRHVVLVLCSCFHLDSTYVAMVVLAGHIRAA